MLRPGVDASASRSLPDIIPDGEPRLLGARLLERTLLRLGRAGTVVERRLAPGLLRMHGRRHYRLLGYVRLADYLTERLGMSLRRCQAILRLERALAGLPRMAQALEAGDVSVSKLEVIAGVAIAETEETWLDRARSLPLASLREAAREASARGARIAASPASALPIEHDEPGQLISFTAPAPVIAIWHWTLDLVRRVAGQQEPAWRCAEFLAAEFLSGVPDAAGNSLSGSPGDGCESQIAGRLPGPRPAMSAGSGPVRGGSSSAADILDPGPDRPALASDPAAPAPGRPVGDTPGMAAWTEASAAVREALTPIGASADPEAILSENRAAGERADSRGAADRDVELDAWELDSHLRRLVRLRQSLAWRQGRLLSTFVSLLLHRDLGFDTFDGWVGDRLAMSPRRARYLVSLDRRLRDLPLLADAYRRGLVSWCQARLLVRVVRPTTQSRWIRYARQVTVRRLEDVIVEHDVAASESSATPAPPAPAHISASQLRPSEPLPPSVPPPSEAATSPTDHAPRHTSAPAGAAPLHTSASPLDHATFNMVRFDRRTWRRISFWCPLDVASLWESALRSCRAAAGTHLEDWECFLLFVRAMRDTWENREDPHWRRRYRILERDGWRCMAPGCTSRSGLNEHHITFRSQDGGDDAANLVTLCVGHHQQGLHEGHIRCFGRAPDGLWWDMGVKPGGEPLARYFGDRLVGRRPFVPVTGFPRVVAPRTRVVTPSPCAAPAAAGAG